MLHINVPASELYDEKLHQFIEVKPCTLVLEHSLVSISKWEAKWNVPFFSKDKKTSEQVLDYIRCMTIGSADPSVYLGLTKENIDQIQRYIEAPMTATTFANRASGRKSREVVTSEVIYYWMIALNIPVEFEKWHIARLLTLIEVCNIKNTPPKKMSKRSVMQQNSALNAARRAKYNSKG